MFRTLALILAGGHAPALSVLSAERTGAAVPVAGKYRVIDFALSNCVNSGIYNVGVLTQHQPNSLHTHLGVGRPWDLDRAQGGLRVLHPQPTPDGSGWQRGTADAARANFDYIADQPVDNVLILASDHIYKMDYRPLLQVHQEQRAELTLAVHSISPYEPTATAWWGWITTAALRALSRSRGGRAVASPQWASTFFASSSCSTS